MLATLGQDAVNFTILTIAAAALLFYDLYLWRSKKRTFSETVWGINQVTLALAFACGLIVGHLLTVPR
jgi:hypothetical protein